LVCPAAAGFSGMGSVGEKQLVWKYVPSANAMLGWLGVTLALFGGVFAVLFPFEAGTSVSRIAAIFGSGFSYGISLAILYRALKTSEASRVYPIYHTAPIFVAIIAVLLLGEVLSAGQWAAIIITVGGAVLISVERAVTGNGYRLGRALLVLLVAAGLAGVGQALAGYALEEISPYTGFWAQRLGCLAIVILFFRKRTFTEMAVTLKNPVGMTVMILTEAVIMPVGHIFFLQAFQRGDIALVATVYATVPIWVFAISSVLSTSRLRLMQEQLTRGAIVQKGAATVLVVLGIIGINLL